MYITNIKHHCPKCGGSQDILQALGNVRTLHRVEGIPDNWYPEVSEAIEIDAGDSESDGFYCGTCLKFITQDLIDKMKYEPELFTWETEERKNHGK